MFKIFRNNSTTPSLHQLDQLYGQTICECSLQEQMAYCQRLIESSRYELRQSCHKADSNHLEQVLEAAECELKLLKSEN